MRSYVVCLLLTFSACVSSTPCDQTQTCVKSLLASGTCTANTCDCISGTTAIYTGCGDAATLDALTPTVNAGVYSGQVRVGRSINLSCYSKYIDDFRGNIDAVTFRWYRRGSQDITPQSSTQSLAVQVTAEGSTEYRCEIIHEPVFQSKRSAAFTVTGYATAANIQVQAPRVLSNVPEGFSVTKNSNVEFACANIPEDSSVTYAWTGLPLTSRSISFVQAQAAVNASGGLSCSISVSGGPRISSPRVQLPVVEDRGVRLLISTPSRLTVSRSTPINPFCTLSPPNIFSSVRPSIGTTATTFQCKAAGDIDVEDSAITEVIAPTSLDQDATIDQNPMSPVLGGRVTFSCFATLATYGGVAFSWSHDNVVIPGQTDNILQLNNIVDKYQGVYRCHVSQAGQPATFATKQLTIARVPATPTIKTDITAGTNYGIGMSHILTCDSQSHTAGFRYQWNRDGQTVPNVSGRTYTITATAAPSTYRCVAIFEDLQASDQSQPFTVQGREILSVTMTDLALMEPVAQQSIAYKCQATTRTGFTGILNYQWLDDRDVPITGQNSDTYVITNPAVDSMQRMKCRVSVRNSAEPSVDSRVASYIVVAAPSAPLMRASGTKYGDSSIEYLPIGGNVDLICDSESHQSGAQYSWFKDGFVLSEKSNTLKLTNIQASARGVYSCAVTVVGKLSPTSPGVMLLTKTFPSHPCSKFPFERCPTDGIFTGHCFEGRCEYVQGGTPRIDTCEETAGTREGSGSVLAVSVLTMLVAFFTTRAF